jgi:hypothetical protein
MHVRAAALAVALGASAVPGPSFAEAPSPPPKIAGVAAVAAAAWRCDPAGHESKTVRIGDHLVVRSDRPLDGYTLLLNGQPLRHAEPYDCGEPAAGAQRVSGYRLHFDDADQGTWEAAFSASEGLLVGLRAADGATAATHRSELTLKKWSKAVMWSLAIPVPLLGAVLFWLLAAFTGMVRDPGPGPARRRPYSLARVQIALWTLLVGSAVFWHYLATGQLTDIPDSLAALMGLSTFTLGAATVIDAGKARAGASAAPTAAAAGGGSGISPVLAPVGATAAAVAFAPPAVAAPPAPAPVSENVLLDLLTDKNGVSMHRLQMVVWTVILAAVFLDAVLRRLFLPELASGYLAITGVSSAGYALLKIPEQQS